MKRIRKRLGAVLAMLALTVILLPAAVPAQAADATEDIQSAIAAYNGSHGGTGALTATLDGSAVTVDGTVTDATAGLDLTIGSGITVIWKASLAAAADNTGQLIHLNGAGTFRVMGGGSISATSGKALFVSGADATVEVSGGSVSATTGSAIETDGTGVTVEVSGGGSVKATGENGTAIHAGGTDVKIKVSDGSVKATGTGGKAIETDDASAAVEVYGAGSVEATGENSTAISAQGEVTVNGGGVKATGTGGTAISAQGKVTVSGGGVEATGAGGKAISAKGKVTVNGGGVEATGAGGKAIFAQGESATVTVGGSGRVSAATGTAISARAEVTVKEGGSVEATGAGGKAIYSCGSVTVSGIGRVSATTGTAIETDGASATVTVSDGRSVSVTTGTAIYTTGVGATVTVKSGNVEATEAEGTAIQASGNVTVSGGNVNATGESGTAIHASGASAEVTVSGGSVNATRESGTAIHASGASATVKVSGGVSATVTVRGGVSATTGTAIHADGAGAEVTVSSGGVVIATTGTAISASAEVTVNGGIVFAYGSAITDVINSTGFTAPTGTGMVIAWNHTAGRTTYTGDTEEDLIKLPEGATVQWTGGMESGIRYSYTVASDTNFGYIPVPTVTVILPTVTADKLNIRIPSNHVYTGIPQGIGTVTPVAGVGAVTVYYTGTGGTAYPKSTTAPTNAGSYQVTADVAEGIGYEGATGLELGTYLIAKDTPAPLAWPTAAPIYYGSTLNTSVLSGGSIELGTFMWACPTEIPPVGTRNFNVHFSPYDTENYNWSGVRTEDVVSIEVKKAAAPVLPPINKNRLCSAAHPDVAVDIAERLPANAGIAGFTVGTATGDTGILNGTVTATATGIQFSANSASANQKVTIPVTVTMANYADATVNIVVTLVDKTQVTLTGVSAADKTYDGAAAAYTGTPANTQGYRGSYEYVWAVSGGASLSAAPKDAGSYTLTVKIPDADAAYMGEKVIPFTISPKALTIKPQNMSLYNGQALPTSFVLEYVGLISGDTLMQVGTPSYELQNNAGAPLTGSATNGSYSIKWANSDSVTFFGGGNYTITKADGVLTISSRPVPDGGGTTAPAAPAPTVSGSTATTTVTPTVKNGAATASFTESQISAALAAAQKAAKAGNEKPQVEIKMERVSGASSAAATLSRESVKALASGGVGALTVSSGVATVTLDAPALGTISGAASGDVTVSAAQVDVSALPAAAQALIGNRPVFEFSVTSGGKAVSQLGGSATVSVPYTLGAGENPNAVIVSYLNAGGNLETVMNGRYDAATGTVVFTTTHFSRYTVGYSKMPFTDVAGSVWYADAVTYLAARGVTGGTTATTFGPEESLTRGQFITLLLKSYGVKPIENAADNFSDAGNTYYTGFLAAAKKLGITNGVGGNRFAPRKAISRQQMFALLYNTLKALDKLPGSASGKTLSAFTDGGRVAFYAQEAMAYLVNEGVVSGNNGALLPEATTTRAQMAQVLYHLLKA